MTQKLIEAGYEIVDTTQKFDICIVNTCTVTNMSDRKSRQHLRHLKEQNKNSIIIAVGCYAQVAKEELENMDEIDIVLGNNEKNDIVNILNNYFEKNEKFSKITDLMHQKEFCDFGNITYTEKTRAVIKIQDGCDRFCSYCIIPYARGRVRSRNPKSIIEEITNIANEGIQEVVLTGIHIASYGKDFKNDYKLIDLLEEINQIDGIKRIRLGSIEPLLITDEFIERLSKLDKICHHFHLSLQSGCDSTLKRMNRRYTTYEFEQIVARLRKTYNDVILTTDIIVGFPGETQEEFNITYNFLKRINFYKMHIFKYSQRKGTKAAVMPNQVDGTIKEKRSKELINLSNSNQLNYNKSYINKSVKVLFEEKDDDFYKGHTSNYILVKAKTNQNLENKIVDVNIIDAETENLRGTF
jgi:threonylcarbamoyladenosine tRNA methylthiotransferase MtaB